MYAALDDLWWCGFIQAVTRGVGSKCEDNEVEWSGEEKIVREDGFGWPVQGGVWWWFDAAALVAGISVF